MATMTEKSNIGIEIGRNWLEPWYMYTGLKNKARYEHMAKKAGYLVLARIDSGVMLVLVVENREAITEFPTAVSDMIWGESPAETAARALVTETNLREQDIRVSDLVAVDDENRHCMVGE